MATIGTGGKRSTWFSSSDGTKEIKSDSNWNAGKTGPKRRKNKDHHAKTGKDAFTKTTHHYGSFAKG